MGRKPAKSVNKKRKKPIEIKIGDMVEVTFNDHVMGSESLLPCRLWGRIIDYDENKIVIESWSLPFSEYNTYMENRTIYALIRSAILSIKKLDYLS